MVEGVRGMECDLLGIDRGDWLMGVAWGVWGAFAM